MNGRRLFREYAQSKGKEAKEFVEVKDDWYNQDTLVTKDNKGEISRKTNSELVNVFVPTTPNPTSGFLLMFPKDEIIYLDMSFEEASKFIVSAGTSDVNTK